MSALPRVLGVACAGSDAYLVVLDAGESEIVQVGPDRVEVISAADPGDGLRRTFDEWRRVLADVKPDVVAVLLPENARQTYKPHSYWSPRCEAETLPLLAAAAGRIPAEKVARATVRTALGLGPLDQAAKAEPKQGRYWSQRALALFTARTVVSQAVENGWPTALAAGTTRESE